MPEPDIIIMDRREPHKKCTIYPLSTREDLLFVSPYKLPSKNWDDYLLLHVEGPPLSRRDSERPLVLIDASWRWAQRLSIEPIINNMPKRSLKGFSTAYPRKSKLFNDPCTGLASVEALYIARLVQGREDLSLFDHYYWKDKFLEQNQTAIEEQRSLQE